MKLGDIEMDIFDRFALKAILMAFSGVVVAMSLIGWGFVLYSLWSIL